MSLFGGLGVIGNGGLSNGNQGGNGSNFFSPLAVNATPFVPSYPSSASNQNISTGTSGAVGSGLLRSPSKEQRQRDYETAAAAAANTSTSKEKAAEAKNENNTNSSTTTAIATSAGPRWTGLDMSGATLRNLSLSLFNYSFLTQIRLNNNQLTSLPSAIGLLKSLTVLDLTSNRIRTLPPEIGCCLNLREILLYSNQITSLPWEFGFLYQLESLGLDGNPLQEPLSSLKDAGTVAIVQYYRDQAPVPTPPPERPWIALTDNVNERTAFTVFCMNILCDKYATPQLYGYCPSWALGWEYRKELILQEILQNNTDIVCLQEVEASQFEFFQVELARQGQYQGIYRPKSRAKTMSEEDARSVDGCAVFFKSSKFSLVTEYLIEFSQLATSRTEFRQCADFFNRVMPKDNIALVVALRHISANETIVIANPHMTWDPAFADVKLVQTALLMDELTRLFRRGNFGGREFFPLLICGDFNALPSSSVYQFMSHGHLVKSSHTDFDNRNYGPYTESDLSHRFRLVSAYASLGELPFTNRTPNFIGTIDFIWYSSERLHATGVLGPISSDYLARSPGFPNAHFPSDHICLVAEFTLNAVSSPASTAMTAGRADMMRLGSSGGYGPSSSSKS